MQTAVITALITGACSVLAVVLTNVNANNQMDAKLDKHMAVLDERISTLSDRVEKHNSLVERTYDLEARVKVLEEVKHD